MRLRQSSTTAKYKVSKTRHMPTWGEALREGLTTKSALKTRLKLPAIMLATAFLLTIQTAKAQTAPIHLRILNGHTGKPVLDARTYYHFQDTGRAGRMEAEVRTGATGTVAIQAPLNAKIGVVVAEYPTCTKIQRTDVGKQRDMPAVATILSAGIVLPNNCGKKSWSLNPGELTLFVRPLHWWERLSD